MHSAQLNRLEAMKFAAFCEFSQVTHAILPAMHRPRLHGQLHLSVGNSARRHVT